MLLYYLILIVFIGVLIYAFCSLVILKQQKNSGAFFKHNFTIPMGATYTSKKHNNVFQTINKKDYTAFPETIKDDEYYFCQNKYVFNGTEWIAKSIRNEENVLQEINGYPVVYNLENMQQ